VNFVTFQSGITHRYLAHTNAMQILIQLTFLSFKNAKISTMTSHSS